MDTAHRTLNYVEVVYLNGLQPKSIKFQHYPVDEAATVFQRTVNKFTKEKRNALICLREENHQLIKSELIKF